MENVIDVFHDNSVKPSIDKISIFGHAKKNIIQTNFDAMVFYNNRKEFSVKHITSTADNHFRELWSISYLHTYPNGSTEKYTMAILIGWNCGDNCLTQRNQRRFKIEFNPNKFKVPDWLLDYFVRKQYVVDYVKNIDLAFDFLGYPKRWFRIFPNSGNTTVASIGTTNIKTDYIGFSDKSANRVKIYDKKAERKRYETYDLETTRVEITLDFVFEGRKVAYDKDCKAFLASSCALSQVSVAFSDTADPFLFALSCLEKSDLDAALRLMSVNTRKKYKTLLSSVLCRKLYCDWIDLFDFLNDEITKILDSLHFDFGIPDLSNLNVIGEENVYTRLID